MRKRGEREERKRRSKRFTVNVLEAKKHRKHFIKQVKIKSYGDYTKSNYKFPLIL